MDDLQKKYVDDVESKPATPATDANVAKIATADVAEVSADVAEPEPAPKKSLLRRAVSKLAFWR